MSKPFDIPIWKRAPFLRLLPPFIAGILLQFHIQVHPLLVITSALSFLFAFIFFTFLPDRIKFKWMPVQGLVLNLILLVTGALLTWQKDDRRMPNWYGHFYEDSSYIVATINEPLVQKAKSVKAEAMVESVIHHNKTIACKGKLLLYFSKDNIANPLQYGDRIIISKTLQRIKNSGNPGAFDYQRYASFQQLFHNVFLKPGDWKLLPGKNINPFRQFIFNTREKILVQLRQYIDKGKNELGIAEALLIGYTNDLDKDLVQAYSNTGVVHIIAISGMHLALIYGILTWLFSKLPLIKKVKWLQAVLILTCLWIFSLLTGGSASVMRSAVMFTFITIGRYMMRQSSIYNSLATSALLMLCYNPYYLWDVGFQLSYLAVAGIVSFQKPIYNLLYVKNKWLDYIWQATALTTAAQTLTFPVCIYYFHQFPLLFLFTNLVAVPLSTAVLYTEILLILFAWIPWVGWFTGKITGLLLWLMNQFIVWINQFPLAVWDQIPATIESTWLLYAVVIFAAAWLINWNRLALSCTLIAATAFLAVHGLISWKVNRQRKMIVYNVPKCKAIDFVSGNQYYFVGDSVLQQDGILQHFHLKPARVALQLTQKTDSVTGLFKHDYWYQFGNKRILVIDQAIDMATTGPKIKVDVIIVSKNPGIQIPELAELLDSRIWIFDASNSLWKIDKWKQACEALNLRHYSIPENGAFVLDL